VRDRRITLLPEMPMSLPELSILEIRVLGVLVEKERTVPDAYPLSLNALILGCNQKNNRTPVLQVSEREVQAALDALRPLSLVIESSGSRVMRYSHNLGRVLQIDEQAVALLAALMLRGPLTLGELRANADRLHRFPDIGSVEKGLRGLAARSAAHGGPLVALLPRVPGEREPRWAHLLSGKAAVATGSTTVAAAPAPRSDTDLARLQAEVARLAAEVAELRRTIDTLTRSAGD
jgi:uncharacterized protein YceH (UPF0502 family)